CADSRYERWKMSMWARLRTRSGIPRASCATFCRLRSRHACATGKTTLRTISMTPLSFLPTSGFGKITARMKAYEIVACLNQLFSEFDKLAEDVGVEK